MFWWLTKKGRKEHEAKIRADEQLRINAENAAMKRLEDARRKEAAEKAAVQKAAAEKAAAEKAAAEKAAAEKAAAEKAAAEKAAAEKAAAEKAAAEKAAAEKAAAEKAAAEKAAAAKKTGVTKEERAFIKARNAARAGRWYIEKKDKNEYISVLKANNGETMLTSEIYASEESAKSGIDTIIKNVDAGKFVVYEDKRGNFYFKLKTAANKLLCVGEIFRTK